MVYNVLRIRFILQDNNAERFFGLITNGKLFAENLPNEFFEPQEKSDKIFKESVFRLLIHGRKYNLHNITDALWESEFLQSLEYQQYQKQEKMATTEPKTSVTKGSPETFKSSIMTFDVPRTLNPDIKK